MSDPQTPTERPLACVVVTHFAQTPERDEILRCCLDALDVMRRRGPLVVCLVSGTPVPPDLSARCDLCLYLGQNPGHVAGESRLIRRGLIAAGWFGARYVLKLASDCLILDPELPWRWIAELQARGKRLVTCKWGSNQTLGTLSFVGEREFVLEHAPDLEVTPLPGNLEGIYYAAFREQLDQVLLLHNYDLDYFRVQEGLGLHSHSLAAIQRFVACGEVPGGSPALWFVPHEDRWEGVERALCAEFAEDPRGGRPPARALEPLRLRVLASRVGQGELGLGGALGLQDRRVVVARERHQSALAAHAPSEVTVEVEVDAPAGQLVHLGLALNDDVYAELQHGDHPMFRGLILDAARRVVADLGLVGVTRYCAWIALHLPTGRHQLTLLATTATPHLCRAVWLFENQLAFSTEQPRCPAGGPPGKPRLTRPLASVLPMEGDPTGP